METAVLGVADEFVIQFLNLHAEVFLAGLVLCSNSFVLIDLLGDSHLFLEDLHEVQCQIPLYFVPPSSLLTVGRLRVHIVGSMLLLLWSLQRFSEGAAATELHGTNLWFSRVYLAGKLTILCF